MTTRFIFEGREIVLEGTNCDVCGAAWTTLEEVAHPAGADGKLWAGCDALEEPRALRSWPAREGEQRHVHQHPLENERLRHIIGRHNYRAWSKVQATAMAESSGLTLDRLRADSRRRAEIADERRAEAQRIRREREEPPLELDL